MDNSARLQRALGYEFSDKSLLALALAHRSVGKRNNERLEFLGDSIVNHVIADALYHRFPDLREGSLSRLRASLVKGETLAELAVELDLGAYLQLGLGERKSGGHRRESILADSFEAVAGAILLDGGYEACRERLLVWFDQRLSQLPEQGAAKDPKTRLQEYLQGRGHPLPDYQLVEVVGEDHDQEFLVRCTLEQYSLMVDGKGSSRRKAEQSAASSALEQIANG
ncbi:MAG: ribonuclease III [Halioglobus sp.]